MSRSEIADIFVFSLLLAAEGVVISKTAIKKKNEKNESK